MTLLGALLSASASAQLPSSNPAASPFGRAPTFLDVNQAFSFHVSLDDRQHISIHWTIAPGYYLYADKFSFHITQPEQAAGELDYSMPAGTAHEDEFFGKTSVYHLQTQTRLTLPRDAPTRFWLEVGFQGCAEAGLCYPPTRQQIEIIQ